MPTDDSFYAEQEEQSRIKSQIVAKYFWAWAKSMAPRLRWPNRKLVYKDLFSGPGRYRDGTPSTPLLVIDRIIRDTTLRGLVHASFCDSNPDYVELLRNEIASLPGVDQLAFPPTVHCVTVDEDYPRWMEQARLYPTLMFVDPWGYIGVSLRLLESVLKDWGCECIVFFNYRRINMALENSLLRGPMEALFGSDRVASLNAELPKLDPESREMLVVENFIQALARDRSLYVLPFRFRDAHGTRTSHHLIFITKNILGYTMMKDIMAKESSTEEQGVGSFEYNQVSRRFPMLFEYAKPLDQLAAMLLEEFAGRTLAVEDVFRRHHVGRPFTRRSYKTVLAQLETDGKIQVVSTAGKRRRNTFADHLLVTFPQRSN